MKIFCFLFSAVATNNFVIDSITVKNNKLYSIYENLNETSWKVFVYDLKNGPISDVFSGGKSYNLLTFRKGFKLKFFDAPEILQEDRNKLWIKALQIGHGPEIDLSFSNWMWCINLTDMSLKDDAPLVKFPAVDNFPQFGYSLNTITNELGSALYVTGGVAYSKNDDKYYSSSSFFKYNYTTKEWKDMSANYSGKPAQIFYHNSAVVDNRYLSLIAGFIERNPTNAAILDFENKELFKIKSMYNLTTFDTFKNTWESTTLSTNMFDSNIAKLNLINFSVATHDSKVYALGGGVIEDGFTIGQMNQYVGALDYKSKTWSWNPIFNEDGTKFNNTVFAAESLVFNEQIIIPCKFKLIIIYHLLTILDFVWANSTMPVLIYDLPSQRMTNTFRFSNTTYQDILDIEKDKAQNKISGIGNYVIPLICICCISMLIIIIHIIYRKLKSDKSGSLKNNPKSNACMQEVWSNPDDQSIERVVFLDRKQYLDTNTDLSTKSNSKFQNSFGNRLEGDTFIEFEN
jgi:hypothetical protein